MKNYLAEFIGTYLLVAVVIGSGIMAESLANGNIAVALLGNTIATGAILFVIIKMFGSISGAHYNPVVSMVFLIRKELKTNDFIIYIIMQITGGMLAILSSHYIFELEILQVSKNIRGEFPLLISEIIATLGLLLTILFVRKNDEASVAIAVGLFITAGYWFTSSTSFANPAVTIARIFTDTFTGIAPVSVKYFITGQIIGALLANYIFNLFEKK
tara:strand:+ start:1954 stop:2598 length:645 start_codon:yes stop_codon:yes gene_type:complete